jgi:hypothetical protein
MSGQHADQIGRTDHSITSAPDRQVILGMALVNRRFERPRWVSTTAHSADRQQRIAMTNSACPGTLWGCRPNPS